MEYILRTNTVSKKYTNYYAVDKVSISIQKGEIYSAYALFTEKELEKSLRRKRYFS